VVIGTAGHVDHGKTTLIRALTGVDTDRLEEEKRRGLTIDLGFAPFTLPSGRTASVVDVPGHEKFLKNMLAGVSGMDLVLLVVAADDGVMPQTREHLEILSLLHVRKGIVVVTKTDLVDPELLELAIEDIASALKGTFLEQAPVVPVSAPTGAGVPELLATIDQVAGETEQRDARAPFRLPIDRVFVKQGFGTVVTGTLTSGTLKEGDSVAVLPAGETSRVRGLQVHGGKRDRAVAGQRVAINLVGLERTDLGRGDWLVPPELFAPAMVIDVRLELLPNAHPLEHRTRIRLHHGTAEIIGRVALLDRDELVPGEAAYAQLLLEGPVVADFGDRFVLRLYAPMHTIGGGTVLNPSSRRLKRGQPLTLSALAAAAEGRWPDLASARLLEAGSEGLTRAELAQTLPWAVRQATVEALVAQGTATLRRDRLVHKDARNSLEGKVLEAIAKGQAQAPWRLGVPREALQAQTQIPLKALTPLLEELAANGELKATGRLWSQATWQPQRSPEHQKAWQTLHERLQTGRFVPEADLLVELPAFGRDLLDDAVEAGEAVRLGQGMFASGEAMAAAQDSIRTHLLRESAITAAQARDLLNTNRKAIIPLLEYLDSRGFTRRQGDVRVLAPER
ncbi:MAG TPA: selenocysteine-specific translation elongation factor, partial [Stenomitos sp.]